MAFYLGEFKHIISTIDDLLSMSDPPSSISISTACTEEDDDSEIFMQLAFSLRKGFVETHLYDAGGVFYYKDFNGNLLKTVEFIYGNLLKTDSSFKKSLKQIRDFDRQHISQSEIKHVPIDRASFRLAEVN